MRLTPEMTARVKATRKQMKLTQAQFAKRLSISLPTLIDIERGQRGFIRPSTWTKIFDGIVMADAPLPDMEKKRAPDKVEVESMSLLRQIKDNPQPLSTEERKIILAAMARILNLSV